MDNGLKFMRHFFEKVPTIQKSTSQSMEFLGWFALSGYLGYAAAAKSIHQDAGFVVLFSLSGFLSSAAIWACSVVAVKKLGYRATDIDIRQSVFLGLINGLIISLLIVRKCQ